VQLQSDSQGHVDASLGVRITRRQPIEKFRAELVDRPRAPRSVRRSTPSTSGSSRAARELVEAKVRAETDRLVAAERQLAETERDRLDLEVADAEAKTATSSPARRSASAARARR
jgi:hypothetical protein